MADPLPEDVAALCNHEGLDTSLYKDFTAQRNAPAATVSSSTAADSANRIAATSEAPDTGLVPADEIASIRPPAGSLESADPPTAQPGLQSRNFRGEPTERAGSAASAGNSNLVELPLPPHRGYAATHTQFREDASPFCPTNPALQGKAGPYYPGQSVSGANYNVEFRGSYHLPGNWYLTAFMDVNNARDYNQQILGFTLRYLFRDAATATEMIVPTIPDWKGLQPFRLQ
jgi:hypothetical protein